MSETKTYVFPESGNNGGGGMMAMLAPLLQQKGIDPNLLVAMNSRNNSGFGGEGSWFIWVIFLFFLMGWGNNPQSDKQRRRTGVADECHSRKRSGHQQSGYKSELFNRSGSTGYQRCNVTDSTGRKSSWAELNADY